MPGDAQSIRSGEIARSIESFTRAPAVGMVVVPSGLMTANRKTIAALATRHRLPAVYAHTYIATSRGLVSYGSDNNDLFHRAAEFVDRILRGAKLAESASAGTDQVQLRHQPQGCQGARSGSAAQPACARRRRDRITDHAIIPDCCDAHSTSEMGQSRHFGRGFGRPLLTRKMG